MIILVRSYSILIVSPSKLHVQPCSSCTLQATDTVKPLHAQIHSVFSCTRELPIKIRVGGDKMGVVGGGEGVTDAKYCQDDSQAGPGRLY